MAASSAGQPSPIRALVFLTVSLLTGVVLIAILYQLITGYQKKIEEAKRPEDMVMVIVAARELYPGVTISEEDLYAVQIPPRFLPEGVFLSPEHVVGRIPRERILANEFVRSDRLADPESGVGLNAVIPRGMRAISINVRDGRALNGLLNPGNYVDMLVTLNPEDKNTGGNSKDSTTTTTTLLQAVFVLGVNSRMQKETKEEAAAKRGKQQPSVTLLVTAEQAENVAHAEQMGEITLALRNDQDVTEAQLGPGVNIDQLRDALAGPAKVEQTLALRKPRPVAAAPAPTGELIIIRGGDITHQTTDENGVIQDPKGSKTGKN